MMTPRLLVMSRSENPELFDALRAGTEISNKINLLIAKERPLKRDAGAAFALVLAGYFLDNFKEDAARARAFANWLGMVHALMHEEEAP